MRGDGSSALVLMVGTEMAWVRYEGGERRGR